jgi:hypothetical protein
LAQIEELLSKKNVIIVHPFHPSEISEPKFGGARLILEQAEFLREGGHNVNLISLGDVGSIT